MKMVALLLAGILISTASHGATFADGQHHFVGGGFPDFPFEGLTVWDAPDGSQTTATFLGAPRINFGLELNGTSRVTSTGTPTITGDVTLNDSSVYSGNLRTDGGTLYLNGHSTADLLTVATDAIFLTDESSLNITLETGTVRNLHMRDSSSSFISGAAFHTDYFYSVNEDAILSVYDIEQRRSGVIPLHGFDINQNAQLRVFVDPEDTIVGIESGGAHSQWAARWQEPDGTNRSVYFNGNRSSASIEVIPEPSVALLTILALVCIGARGRPSRTGAPSRIS